MWPLSSNAWKVVANQKKEDRDKAIARAQKLLAAEGFSDADGDVYLGATASDIVRKIESGEWKAKNVVVAFIFQAIKAHVATNCLTEIRFDDALQEAAALDDEFAKTKTLRGPLHGVPVSFKDQFNIAGFDSCIGFTSWSNKPQTEDAILVKHFRNAGAIIIAKTNVPQTMLSFECNNPVWGRTTNPGSPLHTSGGSSGGEAALLACSGAVIGVGSDVGGSLRIPAGYCGIYSLKTSVGRFSCEGAVSPNPGFEAVRVALGPLTRSVEDIELMCKTLFGSAPAPHENWVPTPWKEPTIPQKLRFGYYTSDLIVKASPACKRAVLETVDALRKQGHECVEFETTLMKEAMYLFTALTSSDGYKTLTSHLGPDPQDPSLFLVTLGPSLPSFLRNFVCWVAATFQGDDLFAKCLSHSRVKNVREFYGFVQQRDQLRKQWYDEVWNKHKLDGIIAPIQAVPAVPHGATKTLAPIAAATILYNVIDCPVGCIPVTRVDPAVDRVTEAWIQEPGHGSAILEQELFLQKKGPVYDVEKMKGLSVGVQVVGRSWEDEKVIGMMHVVDDALRELGKRKEGTFGPGAGKGMEEVKE